MTSVKEYARLIQRGQPTFVEIKGVTFCAWHPFLVQHFWYNKTDHTAAGGDSKASAMTMKNVPYHEEVREFSELVAKACGEGECGVKYEPASEHGMSALISLHCVACFDTPAVRSAFQLYATRPQ